MNFLSLIIDFYGSCFPNQEEIMSGHIISKEFLNLSSSLLTSTLISSTFSTLQSERGFQNTK